MLAFIFNPMVVGHTFCMMGVFRRKGGVAVVDGNRHGGVVFGRNLYGDPRRFMYRTGVLLGKIKYFPNYVYPRTTAITYQ